LPLIRTELREFLESGVSVLVGTRNEAYLPDAMRGMGARVGPAEDEVTVFLPTATAAVALANLAANGRIAVCFSRAIDHRSLQIKGEAREVRPAAAAERGWIDRYRRLLVAAWSLVGVPPRVTLRLGHWPATAVRIGVESWFEQTPGPGAGAPLGEQVAGFGAGEAGGSGDLP
jgi:hypothetical protein